MGSQRVEQDLAAENKARTGSVCSKDPNSLAAWEGSAEYMMSLYTILRWAGIKVKFQACLIFWF